MKRILLSGVLCLSLALLVVGSVGMASVVRIAVQVEPSRLNPITYQDTETGFVLGAVCDPLIELTSEGSFTAEDAIIEDYSISDDGLVYTFYIREGITFHNGDALTGYDVKFTYEAFMDPDLGSPHHRYYVGIETVEVIEDYTVKVTLSEPDVAFLTLARLRGHVLPKAYIEEVGWEGFERNPIGSGPYKFVEHLPGRRIVLEKFEDYWGDKAHIERVEFRFYPELSTAIMALETKDVDFMPEMPAEEFAYLQGRPGIGLKFGTYERFEDHRICFDKRPESIFSDVRLRQAVAYAIDQAEVIALTRGDMAVPARGRVPTFHPAYAADANAYEVDLDKARQLLEDAGYPDGFKTQIYAPAGYRERVQEVQLIERHLARVGIEAEVVTLEWGTYLDVTAEGEAPMFRERWSASVPEPISFVEVWHSESSWNPIFGTYYNEEVDRLIDEIRLTVDAEDRWALYRRVQEIAMDEVASYPLYWPLVGEAYNDELVIPDDLWNPFRRPIVNINKWSFGS